MKKYRVYFTVNHTIVMTWRGKHKNSEYALKRANKEWKRKTGTSFMQASACRIYISLE